MYLCVLINCNINFKGNFRLGYDKSIIAPDFNEVSKQGLGQKLKLSMKSSMKSFQKVLIFYYKLVLRVEQNARFRILKIVN